jgi:hypothetical protein
MIRVALIALFFFGFAISIPISPAVAGCIRVCNQAERECSDWCCEFNEGACGPGGGHHRCRTNCAERWSDCVFLCPRGGGKGGGPVHKK